VVEIETVVRDWRAKIEHKKARREFLSSQMEKRELIKQNLVKRHSNTLLARTVIQKVAEETQKVLEFQISNLVSTAIEAIFPNPYRFELRFIQRRNKTEADLIFIKNGNETDDLLNSAGGGVADIASFALRIAFWSIRKTRPFMLLDEPGKFLSRNLQANFSLFIKELSTSLKLQFLMISHIPEVGHSADRVFYCVNEEGVAKVSRRDKYEPNFQ